MKKDIYTLSLELLQICQKHNLSLAIAESCTGGGLCQAITEISGSSATLTCGFVTYSNESKINMLNVNPETLDSYGAVSAETAKEMALGALNNSNANIAVSITGIAGPTGGTADKPVGTIWIGVAQDNTTTILTRKILASSGRQYIRKTAILNALQLLINASNDYD